MCISDIGIMELDGMVFHAFHGCLESERMEGNTFIVDIKGAYPLGKAAHSDYLEDAYDYGRIYQLVKDCMESPSNLLENVAWRICSSILGEFDFSRLSVRVSKKNPPVGGPCMWSSITVSHGEAFEMNNRTNV